MKPILDIYHRPDNYGDQLVIRENLNPAGDQYSKLVPIHESDLVIDIGGHIGSFAVACAQRGIVVKTYEPDPANWEYLKQNVDSFGGVVVSAYNVAVVPDDFNAQLINFYPNRMNNSGSSRLEHTRGRDEISVPVIKWSEAIKDGTYIKLDCEGAEYALLQCEIPATVRAIVGEMHLASPYTHEHVSIALDSLRKRGFTVKAPALTKQRTIKFSAIRNVVDETEVNDASSRNDSPH